MTPIVVSKFKSCMCGYVATLQIITLVLMDVNHFFFSFTAIIVSRTRSHGTHSVLTT